MNDAPAQLPDVLVHDDGPELAVTGEELYAVCVVCAKPYSKRNRLQVTCGSMRCRNRRHYLAERENPLAVQRERDKWKRYYEAHKDELLAKRQARRAGAEIALCSHAKPEMFEMERRYVNRRMPINLARHLCDDVRRINMSVGAEKSYHIPYSTGFLKDGFVEWWLLGNPVHVASLLFKTRHIGARRGAGYGRVDRWEIAECSTWDGFPVVRDGKPLRALPHDWPGVFDAAPTFATLTAPYWDLTKEEPAWVGT